MKKIVENFMIKNPCVGNPKMSLQEARDVMCEFGIRHLPIVKEEKLVGIVSERDLQKGIAMPNSQKFIVEQFMSRDVYVARSTSQLNHIVRNMMDRKIRTTVIVSEANEVLGIFSITDALRLLANMLDEESSEPVVNDDCYEPWNFNSAIA